MHVIYLLQNLVNGKVYVGKTEKSAHERFEEHIKEAQRGSDRRLCQALRKHGHENFSVTVIEQVSDEVSSDRERHWVAHYQSKNYQFGYNMTDGGEGAPGRLITEATRQKISQKVKSHVHSLSQEERREMTRCANDAKRGRREKTSKKKSEAQTERWANSTADEKKTHGERSAAGVSEEGRKRQLAGMLNAFSPVRQPGYKQEQVMCPHCGKIGGKQAMKRYHFDHCKLK